MQDKEKIVLQTLEEQHPYYDRTNKHWMLTGFIQPKNRISNGKLFYYRNGKIPTYRFNWDSYEATKKYSGTKLRELRVKNGVSKNKAAV